MGWIKETIIDLVITVVIVYYAATGAVWAQWVLYIYTPLLLALKALAAGSGGVRQIAASRSKGGVPPWFYHAIYAVSLGALVLAQAWMLAVGWLLIWALSAAAQMRVAASPAPKPNGARRRGRQVR